MFSAEYQTYVNELGLVLRSRNLAQVKDFYRKWKDKMELGPLPVDDALEAQMHQMICEFPSLSNLHAESRAWLLEHGFSPQVEKSGKKPT